MKLSDDQLEDLQYGDQYASWLVDNAMDYGVIICNGHTMLDAQEKAIGFEQFLSEIGVYHD